MALRLCIGFVCLIQINDTFTVRRQCRRFGVGNIRRAANQPEKGLSVCFIRILYEAVRVSYKAVKRVRCILPLDPVDIDPCGKHGVTDAGLQRFAQRFDAAERSLVHGKQHDALAAGCVFNRYKPFPAGFGVSAEDKADFICLAVRRKADRDFLPDLRRICCRQFIDVGKRSGRFRACIGIG